MAAEARWIVEAAAGKRREALLAGAPVGEDVADRARLLAARRAAGEPLQYVTGVAGFRRLELSVGPGVLVPRPETEVVVERAISHLPPGGTAVDVGTGSGAIALAIANERPDARVLATEMSETALRWARRNIEFRRARVELIPCDLLAGLPADLAAAVHVVVTNPPYVAEHERGMLPKDVVQHEPHEALFAGDDGLEVIARVAQEARGWLRHGGWLVTEIGEGQGQAVPALVRETGYEHVSLLPDLAGRDRIVEGRWP